MYSEEGINYGNKGEFKSYINVDCCQWQCVRVICDIPYDIANIGGDLIEMKKLSTIEIIAIAFIILSAILLILRVPGVLYG